MSLVLVFACVNIFLLSLLCFKHTTRPVLILVLVASSLAAYFVDTYHVIIDDVMIDNIVKTDTTESLDLLSPRLLVYLIFLGVLPSLAIFKLKLKQLPLKKSVFSRVRLAGLSLVIAIATMLLLGGYYASFFREHKTLRYFSNPSYYLYSLVEYVGKSINTYDNAILYTDYFLSKVINLLKGNDDTFEAMMFYISDHGESLDERGLYLHGLPSAIAPDSQKHVPMIMCFGRGFDNWEENNYLSLKGKIDSSYSHDNIFHTILGLMEIQTGVHDKSMDIVDHAGEG